jgi:hypothetical protein
MRPDPSPHPGRAASGRPSPSPLDRRSFLRRSGLVSGAALLAVGAPGLLAACSSSDGDEDAGRVDLGAPSNTLVGLFNYQGDYLVAGTPQRAAFAIATAEGPPAVEGPATLTGRLSREGTPKGEVTLQHHADGTPIGYYPLLTTFDEPGIWSLAVDLDGEESTQTFQVQSADQVALVQPGSAMVPVATPTDADARGVTPICTRDPHCPLHARSLADVLASAQPVALMISTPRYCQTAVCGPVLDLVMEQVERFPDMAFVHAEVYNAPTDTGDPSAAGTTPAITSYGLTFEPSLFVASADGRVTARLDNVFDRTELVTALQTATA